MILPIVAYGHPVLKKKAVDIQPDDPGLQDLVRDMFETMHASSGVGLAGPQVSLSRRIFVVDASPFENEPEEVRTFRKAFINAQIIESGGEMINYNEGCLSFPGLHEDVVRPESIRIRYVDEHFQPHEETYDGILARIIQHEYDHIEGIVFVDRISRLKRALINGRLNDIIRGKVDADYRMLFASQKKKSRS